MSTWDIEGGLYSLEASPGRANWKVQPWVGPTPDLDNLKIYELSLTEGALEKLLLAVHRQAGEPYDADRSVPMVAKTDFVAKFNDGTCLAVEVKDEDPLSNAKSTTFRPGTKVKERPAEQLARYAAKAGSSVDRWALAAPSFTKELFEEVRVKVPHARLIALRTFEHEGRLGLAVLPRCADAPPEFSKWPVRRPEEAEGPWSQARYDFLEVLGARWPNVAEYGPAEHSRTSSALKPKSRAMRSSRGVTVQRNKDVIHVGKRQRSVQERMTITIEPTPVIHAGLPVFRADLVYMMLATGGRKRWMSAAGLTGTPQDPEVAALQRDIDQFGGSEIGATVRYGKQEFQVRSTISIDGISGAAVRDRDPTLIDNLIARAEPVRRDAEELVRAFFAGRS